MPSPNANFDDILSITMQRLEPVLVDQITAKNATLSSIDQEGVDGGPTIVVPIMYAENGSYKRYSGAEQLNTSKNDVFSAFQYPWCQVAINIQTTGRDVAINSGASKVKDLVKSLVLNAKASFQNNFNEDLLSDGSLSNQVNGFQALISDNGTGSVGGVSRSAFSFAKNQFFRATTDGGQALSATNIVGYMDDLDLLIGAYKGNTKLILADNATYKMYEGTVHPLQRITAQDGKLARLGFKAYAYKGAEVVYEPQIAGMPASTMYFIDPDVIKLKYHTDRNLVRLPKRDSFNQDASIEYMVWMGNLVASNFRMLGVLNND